jgi:hypothetical protein
LENLSFLVSPYSWVPCLQHGLIIIAATNSRVLIQPRFLHMIGWRHRKIIVGMKAITLLSVPLEMAEDTTFVPVAELLARAI